jgi:hypothetical protein
MYLPRTRVTFHVYRRHKGDHIARKTSAKYNATSGVVTSRLCECRLCFPRFLKSAQWADVCGGEPIVEIINPTKMCSAHPLIVKA